MKKSLQVLMNDLTIHYVDCMKIRFGIKSTSSSIKKALEIAELLTRDLKKDEKIVIHGPNGSRELVLPCICKDMI